MGHWNYRVMKRLNEAGEFMFGIYEVYYNDDGTIEGSTLDSLTPICGSAEGLKYEMNLMMRAFEKETLLYKTDNETPIQPEH